MSRRIGRGTAAEDPIGRDGDGTFFSGNDGGNWRMVFVMTRRCFLCLVLACGVLPLSRPVSAQEDGGFHEFTGKNGQKLVAKVLRVSEDRRQMRFVRQDGLEFETPITLFSLDDQQYVKDWMKTSGGSPVPTASSPGSAAYRVEISIARTLGSSRKNRDGFYTLEEREHLYRITIRNLSRDTLEAARLDYAVVWDDAVLIYSDEDGNEWHFSTHSDEVKPDRVKQLGRVDLESLRFNASATFDTTPVSVDQVLYDGNDLYREDSLIGVKVRVVGAGGTVVQEAHSGSATIGTMTWEEIEALADPRKID